MSKSRAPKPATPAPEHLFHPIDLGQLYGMLAGLSQTKRLQRPEDQVQLALLSAHLSIAIDMRRLANYTTGEELIDRSALAALEAQAKANADAEAATKAKPAKGQPAATTPVAPAPKPARKPGKKK